MNVRFPGFDTRPACWAIVGVDGRRRSSGMLGFFRYKSWL